MRTDEARVIIELLGCGYQTLTSRRDPDVERGATLFHLPSEGDEESKRSL